MIQLKRKVKICFALLAALVLVVQLGSIDKASVDDKGLLAKIPQVNDADNGYLAIAYIYEPGFSLFLNADERQYIHRVITGAESLSGDSDVFLARHQNTLANLRKAVSYEQFKLDIPEPIDNLPRFAVLDELANLLILESMDFARKGNIDHAINNIDSALQFSARLSLDGNKSLIIHSVAMGLQGEILRWAHKLAATYELTQAQFSALISSIGAVPTYENDGFEGIFSGEFSYGSEMIRRYSNTRSNEDFTLIVDNAFLFIDSVLEGKAYDGVPLGEALAGLVNTVTPRYHFHVNRALSNHAEVLLSLAGQASNYCHQLELIPPLVSREAKLLNFLKPNGFASLIIDRGDHYTSFFEKRCLRYAHRQSVTTIVALERYKARTGRYPDFLQALVPEDLLRVPIDPFDGQTIKYLASTSWVYSAGVNFTDNKGAELAFYDSNCELSLECMKNPTFPLLPHRWYTPPSKGQECTSKDV